MRANPKGNPMKILPALLLAAVAFPALAAGPAIPDLPRASLYDVPAASVDGDGPLDRGSPEFDADGRAFLRDNRTLTIVSRHGARRSLDLAAIATQAINRDIFAGKGQWDGQWDSTPIVDTAVVVDDGGRIYTVIVPRYSNLKTAVLLWTGDKGASWHAFALTGVNAMMETRDSFNDNSGPPTIVSFESYGATTGPRMWLEPLAIEGGALARAAPAALVSERSLLFSKHSGCSNTTFTTPDRIFVVYPVIGPKGTGTAAFGRQYNRATRQFESDELPLGRSLTVAGPDPHDAPGITADARGTLAVVLPGHQVMLQMIRSRTPLSMTGGWSAPELIGQPRVANRYGRYTYPSLTTSRDGTINIIARAEGTGGLDKLVQLQKKPDEDWTVWPDGTVDRAIAVPKRTYYAAWRQRVTMSPDGTLYLNFRYFPDELLPDEIVRFGLAGVKPASCAANGRCWFKDAPDLAPITLVSSDEGDSWRH